MPKNNLNDLITDQLSLERQKVLDRLWEIAYLSPDMTRGSVTAQVKAISMIIAIQNLIPSDKKPAPTPIHRGSEAERPAVPVNSQPNPGAGQPTITKPYVPLVGSIPDLGVTFPVKNPFVHPR